MKILYLTFYFKPDLCAGSFRNTPLVNELSELINENDSIHVITTMPNRYKSFSEEALAYEKKGNIEINRIKLPVHSSGLIDQSLAFKDYFFKTLNIVKDKEYDLVFASSSRLFTAFLGSMISRRKGIPFYADIRDIFVDTLQDVLKNKYVKFPLLKVLKLIERNTVKQATHINLISEGFKPYFSNNKHANFSFYTNGIDPEFLAWPKSNSLPKTEFLITYAGNIGEGQGLHKIIPAAAKLLGSKYTFRIIGDGGKKAELEEQLKKENISNVELLPPTNRARLIEYYKETDYLFLHLNDYKAFDKVLPSKIFEYGATDKPVIAGVGGFAAKFIEKNLSNYILFPPGDARNLADQLAQFTFQYQERKSFIEKYARTTIDKQMAVSILNTANKNKNIA